MTQTSTAPAPRLDLRPSDQLVLFDEAPTPTSASNETIARQPARRPPRQPGERTITIEDLPTYPPEAIEAARQNLLQLPQAKIWFTYKDIRFFFGVSRATVGRRLREGLVPGVRMMGADVVEDVGVRRFDRKQLEWLLLALRHREHALFAPSPSSTPCPASD